MYNNVDYIDYYGLTNYSVYYIYYNCCRCGGGLLIKTQ